MRIHFKLCFVLFTFALAGYSAAALLAIIFAIPFGMRMLIHRDSGRWRNFGTAFYHAHLELFLGNGCLGKSDVCELSLVHACWRLFMFT